MEGRPAGVACRSDGRRVGGTLDYVIKTVGADHVAIGLDMTAGRSAVLRNASGYADLVAALNRITTPENVRKVSGENWFRVLDQAKA